MQPENDSAGAGRPGQTRPQVRKPDIRLTEEPPRADGLDRTFSRSFRIGREPSCEIRFDADVVSRVHAAVALEEGVWWVRDLDSTNGVFVDGVQTRHAPLKDGALLRLAPDGPALRVSLEAGKTAGPPTPPPPSSDASLSQVIQHYFQEGSDRVGGHYTQMIRQAYSAVKRTERRRYAWLFATLGILFIAALSFGVYQKIQNRRHAATAAELFFELKSLDVQTFDLRRAIEQQSGSELTGLLTRIEDQRRRLRARYDGYVEELGVYRKLKSEEERLIYRTARIFNESEFAMTAAFVEQVKEKIGYWQTTGRDKYGEAVQRAEDNGYTPYIVETLKRYGLAPEFYYLALQESAFLPDRIGPATRFGYAKGMWQFIPKTASEYGLDPGARAHTAARDPTDQRQNFLLATEAAARYLLDIHGELTQASGLLAMAAYNWGEHQVGPRLESLPTPKTAFAAAFADVPTTPNERNYWRFLEAYGRRIPSETRDYVLKIFAAAVIGQNPRDFGFDFDGPLAAYAD